MSLGFAIPAATVLDVADQLLKTGTVQHPYLGVSVGPLTPSIQRQLGVQVDHGAVVLAVDPNAPAATAGFQSGDIVVGIAGKDIRSVEDLLAALRASDPGRQLAVQVVRGGRHQTLTATIGSRTE